MKCPQTLAEKINESFPNKDLGVIADNSCCALVLMWCLGIEPADDFTAIKTVQSMRQNNVISKDCRVYWYKAVPYLTGRELKKVDFVKIRNISEIKKRTPVLYAKEGNAEGVGHWVGVENGVIAFNPKAKSINVEEGRPVEMRVLSI